MINYFEEESDITVDEYLKLKREDKYKYCFTYDEVSNGYILDTIGFVPKQTNTTQYRMVDTATLLTLLNNSNQQNRNYSFSLYEKLENGQFIVEETTKTIDVVQRTGKSATPPPGIYEITSFPEMKIGLKPYVISSDEYVDIGHQKDICVEIDNFLQARDRYKELGLLHKRGFLFYGPPGNGKTLLIEQLAKKYSDRCRIIFNTSISILKDFRKLMSDIPTIFVLEEFTEYGGSDTILSFLDGQESWDGCLVIATTNYPERIPTNLIDRPSRFDKLVEFGLPTPSVREAYLISKLGSNEVTKDLVEKTGGYSIAYLKELIVASKIYNRSFEDIFNDFTQRKDKIKKFISKTKKGSKRTEPQDYYDYED